MKDDHHNPTLSRGSRDRLLELARRTIADRLGTISESRQEPPFSKELEEPRGAFVTLKIDGRLRGCIGRVIAVTPLWQTVRDNAIAAAFEDPRFPRLSVEELSRATIEISVLTPMQPAASSDVEVGRHGVMIERGAARGLLLPQVAVEHGWDRETLLEHTCRKAGLEPGCWRHPDTVIKVFSAEVFGEASSRS
jgi:AmmeMemoRadiSam system protein A